MNLPEISEDNPIDISPQKDIDRILHNIENSMIQLTLRMEDLSHQLEVNTVNIEILEESLSAFVPITGRPKFLRFDHNSGDLYITRKRKIRFDNNQAELLALMFSKTSGKPKYKKFQISEEAKKLSDEWTGEYRSAKAVHSCLIRIQEKLELKFRLGDLLTITTKEFHLNK